MKVVKEKKFQEALINSYNYSVKQCKEIYDLYNLALEENNTLIINESLKNLEELTVKDLKNRTQKKVKVKDIIKDLKPIVH